MTYLLKLDKLGFTLFFVSLFLLSQNVLCQDKIEFQSLLKKYPGEKEILISNETTYQIKNKSNKLEILQSNYKDYMIMDKNGVNRYTHSFYSSELSPVRAYSAYTIKANGSKVKTELASVSGATDNSIFYDDVKKTEITFTNLEPGARKVLKTSKEFLDPALLHKFVFGEYMPAEKYKFSVEVDKGIEIGYKIFNDNKSQIKLDKKQKGSKTIYTWTAKNIEGYNYEDRQPSFLSIAPHIAIYIKSYPDGKESKDLFGDVDRLFNHYGKYVDKLNLTVDKNLKKITEQVIEGAKDEEEKVKKIFYWVKDNIKYIAYENGYEGFIPREASFVCERKFGDCKDMASILTAMSSYAGIDKVKLAWIGSRDLPYTYEDLPTPGVDNHMIAAYVDGKNVTFLDATDQNSRYGLCSSFIQGKEALVRMSKNEYIISKVPIISPELNKIDLNIEASLEDTKIVGEAFIEFNGLSRASCIARLSSLKEERQFKFIKNMTNLGNNKYQLEKYEESNREERDSSFRIDFDFNLDNYIVSLDEELYVNMFLKKFTTIKEIDKDREYPVEHKYINQNNTTVTLALGNKYKVDAIPDPIVIENDMFYFKSEYTKSNNKLQLKYTLELKQIQIQKADFETWNKDVKAVDDYIKESIVLRK